LAQIGTKSGTNTSSTTGRFSGRRGVRSFRARTGAGAGTGSGITTTGVAGSARSNSSCPGESRSLEEPKTRLTSRSTFWRRSAFSACNVATAANAASSWRVRSASRGVMRRYVCKSKQRAVITRAKGYAR
jgi:hypothetical protein